MRRFNLTSSKFDGEVELIYGADETISVIDMSKAKMDGETKRQFKNAVAADVKSIGEKFTKETTIVEKDFEVTFEMFWTKYDHKINRKRCEQLWAKMSKAEQVKAYYGIDAYNEFLRKTEWRKKADPEKYLRSQYWENEWK